MSDAPELPAVAHKKVAGLSVGVWAAITAGALATAYAMRRRAAAPAVPTAVAGATGYLDNTQPGAGNLGAYAPSNPTAAPPASSTPQTNEEWGVAAQRFLFAAGFDPAAVDVAIRHYLNGDPLSTAQQAMVSIALLKAGPTPQAVPPPLPGTPDPIGGPVPQLPPGSSPIVTPPPTSVQTHPTPALPTNGGFVDFIGDDLAGKIFGRTPTGELMWLSPGQYQALGSPGVTHMRGGFTSFVGSKSEGKIYGVTPTGERVWLSPGQYQGLGSPATTEVP